MRSLPVYPIEFSDSVVGNLKIDDFSSQDSMLFSILLDALFASTAFLGGIMMIDELKCQSLQRYISIGLTPNQIYFAEGLIGTLVMSFAGMTSVMCALWFTGSETSDSHFLGFLLIVVQVIAALSMGQLFAIVFRSEVFLLLLVYSLGYSALACQGVLVSPLSQPYYFQSLSKLLPCSEAFKTLKAIYVRQLGFFSPEVYQGFVVSLAYFFICSFLSHRLFRKEFGRL